MNNIPPEPSKLEPEEGILKYADLERLLQTDEQGRFAKLAQTFNVDDKLEDTLGLREKTDTGKERH